MAAGKVGFAIIADDGSTVGTVTINHNRSEAMKSAYAAGAHVSTPDDIQFSTFSDGSHCVNRGGGVALVYNRHWMPPEYTDGSAEASRGWNVKGAWSYRGSAGAVVMEAVGVLESLYAANEEIKLHLHVLEKHGSTVKVNVMTDCQAFLLHYGTKKKETERTRRCFPPLLHQRIKEMMVTLQGHGIPVVVEMHWCPRNSVRKMEVADALAGEAMKTGRGYNQEAWSEDIRSVVMKPLVPLLPESVSYTQIVPDTDEAEGPPKKPTRRKKTDKRKAEDEMEEGKPTKKAKTSYQPQAMPASWGLDPDTKVYVWNPDRGVMEETTVVSCPFVRKTEASTMETGERNVFVNDGVSVFSMAQPTEEAEATRPTVAV